MFLRNQNGTLSLAWCITLFILLSGAAMITLLLIRYERNPLAEIRQYFKYIPAAKALTQIKSDMNPESVAIRKCIVKGKTVYSNIHCGVNMEDGGKLDLQDSRGINPSKIPQRHISENDVLPAARSEMIEQEILRE